MIQRGSAEWFARLGGYLDSVRQLVDEHGWAVQGVFPTAESPGLPFAYTVGLTLKGLPELICVGLPLEMAHAVLNDTAQLLVLRGGLTESVRLSDDTPALRLRPVAPNAEGWPLSMAMQLYGREAVSAVQVVWADDNWHYPTDAGWNSEDYVQPLLPEAAR